MSEHQYVGARYVPKFSDPVEWQNGTSYEALTIVTYNNASYTSKVPVPATVGNPAQNPEYWALTGNYNGQVESYRQETETVKGELAEVKSDLNSVKSVANSASADLATLKAEAKPENWDIVIVGDSYSVMGGLNNWPQIIKSAFNISDDHFHFIGRGGYGMAVDRKFSSLLDELADTISDDEKKKITHIIVAGGANDFGVTDANLYNQGFNAFKNSADKFPNAHVYVGMVGSCVPQYVKGDTFGGGRASWSHCCTTGENYIYQSNVHGFTYLNNSAHWGSFDYFDTSDYVHPNQLGENGIAWCIMASLLNNSYSFIGTRDVGTVGPIANSRAFLNLVPNGMLLEWTNDGDDFSPAISNNEIAFNIGIPIPYKPITTTYECDVKLDDGSYRHAAWQVEINENKFAMHTLDINDTHDNFAEWKIVKFLRGYQQFFIPFGC